MKETKAKIWITNIRKGQTKHRDNLDIFSYSKNGILKVSPFFYWSDEKLDEFIRKNELMNNIQYFDPTKDLKNRECVIHN